LRASFLRSKLKLNSEMGQLLIFIMFFICTSCYSQTRVIKPVKKSRPVSTNLGIGGSITRSVLYLSRNVKENNDAKGYSFSLVYGGARLLRLSTEFTRYRTINIVPTWYNISAATFELNGHLIARFQTDKAYFYPIFGVSYNTFSGFFTGQNDFLHIGEKHSANTTVITRWLGLNIGTGFEYKFKAISAFMDYKMRIGKADRNQLNIMDVCYHFGFRYNLKIPSVYKLFSGTRNRYFLEPSEN
jgi:hypothetical protein